MQRSVADLLLWHMKGASRLPCHYCGRAMWRSPDVNMGVSMLEWWKLSSSDRQEGLMFELLLPWKQTLVLGGSSSYCGSECEWMLLVKGNDHFRYMCTDMMMLSVQCLIKLIRPLTFSKMRQRSIDWDINKGKYRCVCIANAKKMQVISKTLNA